MFVLGDGNRQGSPCTPLWRYYFALTLLTFLLLEGRIQAEAIFADWESWILEGLESSLGIRTGRVGSSRLCLCLPDSGLPTPGYSQSLMQRHNPVDWGKTGPCSWVPVIPWVGLDVSSMKPSLREATTGRKAFNAAPVVYSSHLYPFSLSSVSTG